MKHKEEIDQIRSMLNRCQINETVQNGFSKTLNDEELFENVTYIHKKDFGLSCDIIVDCGENYLMYKHPLCLYMVEDNDVHPVLIQDMPISVDGSEIPFNIKEFIKKNTDILQQLADLDISGPEFFDEVRRRQEHAMVVEMSVYGREDTGLPIKVYVDDTKSYQKSGHNGSYRFKFQQDKDVKNPIKWMPVAIPSLEIMDKDTIPPCKIKSKDINLTLTWAQGNMDLFLMLRDGKITGVEFKDNMKKIDEIDVILDSEINK